MKFVADPILDVRRQAYKREYDENFSKIRDARDYPELLEQLQKKEKKLQTRTMIFLRNNAFYFSRKRRHLMEKIFEHSGAYDADDSYDRRGE